MFLVVFYHVAFSCLGITLQDSFIHKGFCQIRMPMFFFVSGFVLYKAGVVWNKSQIISFFKKKIPVQLLSPLLFFIIYMNVRGLDIATGLWSDPKYGYWFTFVLFEYFVIYVFVRALIRNFWADVLLIVIGLLLLPMGWPVLTNSLPVPQKVIMFFSLPHFKFFLYFVVGSLTKKVF